MDIDILKEAVEKQDISIWNQRVINNSNSRANLRDADLNGADLRGLNLSGADLINADLIGANLRGVDLSKSKLNGANLNRALLIRANLNKAKLRGASLINAKLGEANLNIADLSNANLRRASLMRANLNEAKLIRANLHRANLSGASLIKADLTNAILEGCFIYGISVWDAKLEGAIQKNLHISSTTGASITVDNVKVAQFIYLLLHDAEVRNVIDTLTSKSVLILGRFTDERKAVLDTIRDDLRNKGFLPILFDFEKPSSRDLTETIRTLASLSRFIIADLTEPSSIPHELANIVPNFPSIPVKPIILTGNREYAMIENLYRYPWMLPAHEYETEDTLIAELDEKVIQPAQIKAEELKPKSL